MQSAEDHHITVLEQNHQLRVGLDQAQTHYWGRVGLLLVLYPFQVAVIQINIPVGTPQKK